jgi:phage gpG-like protein
MAVTVKIIENNKDEILGELDEAIERALEAMGLQAESYVKFYETAVDTGLLRNSITHQVSPGEKVVYIGTNVEYAPYVEFGHRLPSGGQVAGIHYLEKGIMNHLDVYGKIAEQALKGF